MALAPLDATVRAAINAGFLAARGAPPTADELAARTKLTRDEVFDSLRRLDALGSVTLRPQTMELWTAPPFSATPTLFRVSTGGALYWGSCAWSALGICALAGAPGTIRGSLGGEGEDVEVTLGEDGPHAPMPLYVHFAIPAARWADSLPYTHSMTLFFRSVEEVDSWSERRRLPRCEVVPIQQAWKLAVSWYGGSASAETHLRHRADLEAIFRSVDLGSPFFQLRPRHLW
jgi:hypothetical protein